MNNKLTLNFSYADLGHTVFFGPTRAGMSFVPAQLITNNQDATEQAWVGRQGSSASTASAGAVDSLRRPQNATAAIKGAQFGDIDSDD